MFLKTKATINALIVAWVPWCRGYVLTLTQHRSWVRTLVLRSAASRIRVILNVFFLQTANEQYIHQFRISISTTSIIWSMATKSKLSCCSLCKDNCFLPFFWLPLLLFVQKQLLVLFFKCYEKSHESVVQLPQQLLLALEL